MLVSIARAVLQHHSIIKCNIVVKGICQLLTFVCITESVGHINTSVYIGK